MYSSDVALSGPIDAKRGCRSVCGGAQAANSLQTSGPRWIPLGSRRQLSEFRSEILMNVSVSSPKGTRGRGVRVLTLIPTSIVLYAFLFLPGLQAQAPGEAAVAPPPALL